MKQNKMIAGTKISISINEKPTPWYKIEEIHVLKFFLNIWSNKAKKFWIKLRGEFDFYSEIIHIFSIQTVKQL